MKIACNPEVGRDAAGRRRGSDRGDFRGVEKEKREVEDEDKEAA